MPPLAERRYLRKTSNVIPTANTTTGTQKWLSVRMALRFEGFKLLTFFSEWGGFETCLYIFVTRKPT